MLELHYSTSDMCAVLSASLTSVGERMATYTDLSHAYFYEGNDAIVFPPVADAENIGLDSIDETLRISIEYCRDHSLSFHDRKMLFPVAEAQELPFGISRMHWVTLHYDPCTKTATIVDSRPWWSGYFYPKEPLKQSLMKGLARLELDVQTFAIEHQDVQKDSVHCGAWTATNIRAFAMGTSIAEQMTAVLSVDSTVVVQRNIDLVEAAKKNISSIEILSSDHSDDNCSYCSKEEIAPEPPLNSKESTCLANTGLFAETVLNRNKVCEPEHAFLSPTSPS